MTINAKWMGILGATTLVVAASWLSAHGGDDTVVQLCDGKTKLTLDTVPQTPAEGMAVASALMSEWQEKNPGIDWVMPKAQDPQGAQDPLERQRLLQQRYHPKQPYDNHDLLGDDGQKKGHPYRDFTERDLVLWKQETMRLVYEGAEVFHDADKLGSTIAVSCDMCHPDAANTHPETYPKYQTQLGRAVVLREMINWCIQHPVRGKPLAYDDPRMIALEAYIYAQRRGETLEFGKH